MAIDVLNLHLKNFYEVKIAYKTVVKLMKELHIVCKVRNKRYRYISQISNKITPNLLKRDFKKDEPNIHGSQMYQSLDLIVNVYICLSFKIFTMAKSKVIKYLEVRIKI
ncbi:hypothetical protein [Paracholeplasma brassicae]|nr:hypothetical protein [Paracholeplasma brassicae]